MYALTKSCVHETKNNVLQNMRIQYSHFVLIQILIDICVCLFAHHLDMEDTFLPAFMDGCTRLHTFHTKLRMLFSITYSIIIITI